jgi:hypothetical protein
MPANRTGSDRIAGVARCGTAQPRIHHARISQIETIDVIGFDLKTSSFD